LLHNLGILVGVPSRCNKLLPLPTWWNNRAVYFDILFDFAGKKARARPEQKISCFFGPKKTKTILARSQETEKSCDQVVVIIRRPSKIVSRRPASDLIRPARRPRAHSGGSDYPEQSVS
jgi:hypothetical protein